jgi:mono/diheme cytochrome c family protein
VQPILDKHCVACHSYDRREGNTILSGDLGPQWSHSFFSLFAHLQVADGRNGLGNHPPRTIGSSASPLLEKLRPDHHGVQVSPQEWRTLWLWIESGAPFAGSYAGLRNAEDQAVATNAVKQVFVEGLGVFQRRCAQCHATHNPTSEAILPLPFNPKNRRNNRPRPLKPTGIHERIVRENDPLARFSPNILLNFTRPPLSPLLLGPLAKEAGGFGSCGTVFRDTSDADYKRLLDLISQGKAELDVKPRYGTPQFQPNRQYVREMKRYGILPASFDPLESRLDFFQADQAYWRSCWHNP